MIIITSSWLFQMANLGLLVSYAAFNILWLRFCLAVASLCFVIWGTIEFDGAIILDAIIWNSAFAIINVAHAAKIIYDLRRIEFEPVERRAELESVYTALFAPVGMSRLEFLGLTRGGMVEFLSVVPGAPFFLQGNPCRHLSVIVEGQLQVRGEHGIEGARLGTKGIEMIDAVEYAASRAGLKDGNVWSVNMSVPTEASGPAVIMRWDRDALETRLVKGGRNGPRTSLDAAIGVDIVRTFFVASKALNESARVLMVGKETLTALNDRVTLKAADDCFESEPESIQDPKVLYALARA